MLRTNRFGKRLGVLLGAGACACGAQTEEGSASAPQVERRSDALLNSIIWQAEADQQTAFFGFSTSRAGDVNGDGFDDVIVSAPYYDTNEADAVLGSGRVYVYLGQASGLAATPAWALDGVQEDSHVGWAVAGAGDVNGDGFDDVLVGETHYANGQTDEGRAYLYLGSASGLATSPAWTAESDQVAALFGYALAGAGDVNNDGFDDVIVGARNFDNGQSNEGRAFLYLGGASGLSSTANWTAESNQASALFGFSVAGAGDVNNDGFDDVIVGAHNFDNGQSNEGRAFVYLGSASGLSSTPNWTAESDQAAALFGYSVAGAGDVNNDGHDDVIIGARQYDGGQTDEGRAYVYFGSASGPSSSPDWATESNQASAYYGSVVAGAGDVNNDGFDDVLVGAPEFDKNFGDEGSAFLFLGSPTGPAGSPANWETTGAQLNARHGSSLSGAGDLNNDGYADVVVAADSYSNPDSREGRVVAYLGGTLALAPFAGNTGRTALAALLLAAGYCSVHVRRRRKAA